MRATARLFDADSHLFVFDATVLSCEPLAGGEYAVILDRTAFFPEGGGQDADRGTLGGVLVRDVQVSADGVICHTLPAPLSPGAVVRGEVDAAVRLERMQCHSGEHLVSGAVYAQYGFHNVGFHLGDEDVTLDFDGVLTREQLNGIEDTVNRYIRACLPVRAFYPAPEELATLQYRAKLALTENVRIVEIGDGDLLCDRCACCAPHVRNTGEIGLIKLLDCIHYKGGIRVHMLAGSRALRDYRQQFGAISEIAVALSVRREDAVGAFRRVQTENEELRHSLASLRRQMQDLRAAALPETDGNLCLFEEGLDMNGLRQLLNRAVHKCSGVCGVFTGSDEAGYAYVIGRRDPSLDLRRFTGTIRETLNARGGGSAEMLQGRAAASRSAIQSFFDSHTFSDG